MLAFAANHGHAQLVSVGKLSPGLVDAGYFDVAVEVNRAEDTADICTLEAASKRVLALKPDRPSRKADTKTRKGKRS